MNCTCGGESEVLERRGNRRRRRCKVCGLRWSTVEVRVGVKPPSLPPALAKLGHKAKQSAQAKAMIRRRRHLDDIDVADDDTSNYLHTHLPEIFDER